jgi:hypothetical protein
VQALLNGLVLRGSKVNPLQISFDFMNDRTAEDLHVEWENISQREKRSRTLFAQYSIKVEEVVPEVQAMRAAIGTAADVERFVADLVRLHGGYLEPRRGALEFHLPNQQALHEAAGNRQMFRAGFTLPVPDDTLYLARTHPIVVGLAAYTLDTALDPLQSGVARRASVIRTRGVTARVTLFLLRYRYHILTQKGGAETALLAEACEVMGFRGRAENPEWLSPAAADHFLQVEPETNIPPQQATVQIEHTRDALPQLQAALNARVTQRGQELLDAHRRVRSAARLTGVRHTIQPQLPADVLGIYILLPIV